MTGSSNPSGRDPLGRFMVGNPGGPGGSRRRAELRRAAEEAVTPEHITAVVRRAVRMALEGNLGAAKLVLDHTCGKAAESPAEPRPLGFTMPPLQSVADCSAAIDLVTAALCAGQIDPSQCAALNTMIQARLKLIEANEVEARLTRLEQRVAGPQAKSA